MDKLEENNSLILVFLLLGAAGSYFLGLSSGVFVFLIFGGIFELAFWIGLLSTNHDTQSSANDKVSE